MSAPCGEPCTSPQPAGFPPPGASSNAHVSGEHFTSKTHPGLILKATFSKGGWRSEVRDGSLSQLPPSSRAAHPPSQRQENKRGGVQLYKRALNRYDLNIPQVHARIKGVAGCCMDLVTLGSNLPALATKDIPASQRTFLE